MRDLEGKTAVITGAGSGFGREFARAGASLGMKLVLTDIQNDSLQNTADELRGTGADVLTQRADVADGAQVQALADATMNRFGAVHLLFNNAGVATSGLVWEHSERDWQWTLGVNLWGVIHGVRIFTPLMLAAAKRDPAYRGHIVNTASMAGLLSPPLSGAYNASKHAVVSLTETLFYDLSLVTRQVRCSVLCPYFVPTGIADSERHRPAEMTNAAGPALSQIVGRSVMEKAVHSGKVSAAQVAAMTFDAVSNDAFYVFSHPQALGGVRERMEHIVGLREPADPYATRPELRDGLEAALRGCNATRGG
jgi:NAD(P)-dependent dehydrogenase (short-subunit alcohol dehydrogenase family)